MQKKAKWLKLLGCDRNYVPEQERKKFKPRLRERRGLNSIKKLSELSNVGTWTDLVITMHILCLLWHQTSQTPVEPWLLKHTEPTSSCPVNHLLRKCRANMKLRGGRKCNNAISIYRSVSWFCCLSSARRKARPSFGSWEPEMRGMRGFQIWHSRGIFGILWALFLLTLDVMYWISRYVWFLPQNGGGRHIFNP